MVDFYRKNSIYWDQLVPLWFETGEESYEDLSGFKNNFFKSL